MTQPSSVMTKKDCEKNRKALYELTKNPKWLEPCGHNHDGVAEEQEKEFQRLNKIAEKEINRTYLDLSPFHNEVFKRVESETRNCRLEYRIASIKAIPEWVEKWKKGETGVPQPTNDDWVIDDNMKTGYRVMVRPDFHYHPLWMIERNVRVFVGWKVWPKKKDEDDADVIESS